ncbi:MAG: hypothetical protein GX798_02675 [Bacteroidales bacterium]|nr:hypothetical protein [Bacteroidales bacterium]
MKKIVLLLLLTMFSFSAIGANKGNVDTTLARVSSKLNIESVKMDGSLFKMMMPLMGIDRKTRKAFKAMNIEEIIITDLKDESEEIISKVIGYITGALEADGYAKGPQQESASETEAEEIKADAFALVEEEIVRGLAIHTYFPKAGFLCIRCSMKVSELEEIVNALMPE